MTLEADQESPLEFLKRTWNALLRLFVLFLIGVVHRFFEKAIPYVVPKNMPSGDLWLNDCSFVIFTLIYAYLLWETAAIFIPFLRPKTYSKQEKVEDGKAA